MAQNSNPIPEILELIPVEGTVLSFILVEKILAIVQKCTHLIVTNGYVIQLLAHLNDNGLIVVDDVNWPGVSGNMYILRKTENGTQL